MNRRQYLRTQIKLMSYRMRTAAHAEYIYCEARREAYRLMLRWMCYQPAARKGSKSATPGSTLPSA